MRSTTSLFVQPGNFAVRRLTTTVFIALGIVFSTASLALDVPLTVKENADTGITAFPISAVVPLPPGLLTDARTLGLQNRPAQVEVLERWPKDGSLRHVLVHFQGGLGSHQTSTVQLTSQAPLKPPKPATLQETLDSFTINTGPLRVRVRKTAFNLLDTVWLDRNGDGVFVDDERIVLPSAANGGVFTPRPGAGAVQYDSARTDLAWTVEERGPLRVVLRVEAPAQFQSTSRHVHGFAVRLYAYAGQPLLKIDYQLQNSDKNVVRSWPLYLDALTLDLRLNLLGNPTVAFGLGNGRFFKSLRNTGLYLAQQLHHRFRILQANGTVLHDSGILPNGTGPDGLIEIRDARHGVMAVIRNFWQQWPNGLALSGQNRLSLQLFPPWGAQWVQGQWVHEVWQPKGAFSPSGLYWIEDMQHVYKEALLYFHGPTVNDATLRQIARTFQFPPTVSATTDWYRQTRATLDLGGVIPPATKIPAPPDRRQPFYRGDGFDPADWYRANGPFYGAGWQNFFDPEPGYRSYACMHGGWPYSGAHFIATGNPGDYFEAEGHSQGELNLRPQWLTRYAHTADWNRLRLTENPYCGGRWRIFEGHDVSKLAAPPLPGTGGEEPVYFARDDQHGWFYHVADAYFLTGNPWIRDGYRFIAQFRRVQLERLDPFPDTSSRAIAHSLHQVVQAYRITGDASLLVRFRDHLRRFLKPAQDPLYGDQRFTVEPDGGGFQTGYLMRTIATYLDEVRARGDWQAYAEGFNYLSGLVEWNYRFGNFPYYFDARKGGTGVSSGTGLTLVDPQAWYYWRTGQRRYLDQINRYLATGINGGEPPYGEFGQWTGQFEGRWYLYARYTGRPDATPPPAVTNLTLKRTGANAVELRWTAPTDAARYHVVWSSKPIVAHSTSSAVTNWWAAQAVGPNLTPQPGQSQSLAINGVPGVRLYAALFSFDRSDNMSALSNVAAEP